MASQKRHTTINIPHLKAHIMDPSTRQLAIWLISSLELTLQLPEERNGWKANHNLGTHRFLQKADKKQLGQDTSQGTSWWSISHLAAEYFSPISPPRFLIHASLHFSWFSPEWILAMYQHRRKHRLEDRTLKEWLGVCGQSWRPSEDQLGSGPRLSTN